MKIVKTLGIFLMLLVSMFVVPVLAGNFGEEPGIDVLYVKINGDEVTDDETVRTELERGNELDITVKLQSNSNYTREDVEVSAFITGFEYNDDSDERLSDTSEPFDVEPNVVYTKKLTLKLPTVVEQDSYKLRVVVSDRYSSLKVFNFNLLINAARHSIQIKDVMLSPDDEIKAGRALIAVVRVKNVGDRTEEDVKIKVEMPELGISATDYIDEIESDSSKSSEELYLRIPANAKAGTYTVKTTITFDNDHGNEIREDEIKVLASEVSGEAQQNVTQPQPSERVVVSVDSQTKVVTRGEGGAMFPVTITNEGTTTRSFTLTVDGVDWATVKMSPSNVVVLNPGETKAVYLYVAANEDAAVGEHMFSVSVKSGDKVLETATFKADVIESIPVEKESAVKAVLTWVLLVLIAILIVVGVIVAVQKTRKGPEEPGTEDLTQTYY